MKPLWCAVLMLLVLAGSGYAESFDVGGKKLEIPPPTGFVRVTPQMGAVYRVSTLSVDSANDLLAYYIVESDVPAAMTGELPEIKRYFVVKANKKLKDMTIGDKEFAEIKTQIKKQSADIINQIKSKSPEIMDNASKGLSKELNINVAMQFQDVVPLEPHYETNQALSNSTYMKYKVSAENVGESTILAMTTTYVNTAGRILFLYAYGPKDDLEWTRSASMDWTNKVLASNPKPPPSTPGGTRGFDWGNVAEKGIAGAIVGGVLALIAGLFSKLKKKDEPPTL